MTASSGQPQSGQEGIVYLVGAGPGDPGLLTLRGAELLSSCEVLVYDALISSGILELCPPGAERIYVGKRGSGHTLEQMRINALLAEKAKAGKRVVRLKGGDPYVFGRGAEEVLYLLEQGVAVDVIPGVTAGLAAPAYAGIPVTHREYSSAVAFVTGHEDPTKSASALDWAALAKVGTLCIYMGIKNLGLIVGELSKHRSPDTPAAVIEWGTIARQRSVSGTLRNIEAIVREAGLRPPAITVVGEVIQLRDKLNFFEAKPLFGKRIVVTRSSAQASDLSSHLQKLGAETILFPMIRIAPPDDATEFRKAIRNLSSFDWLVLSSVNGVDAVFEELARQGGDARSFGAAKVAAVGSATSARLQANGIRPDLIPPKYVAESIVESLKAFGVFDTKQTRPLKFLLARADIARSALPEQLMEMGGEVLDVVAYRTLLETSGQQEALQALQDGEADAITFTSGSTARNFIQIIGEEQARRIVARCRTKFLSIGPVTSETMRDLALPVHGEAKQHDISGLISLIKDEFAR